MLPMYTEQQAREVYRNCDPHADTRTAKGRQEIRNMVRAAAIIDRQPEDWVERHCRRLGVWEV